MKKVLLTIVGILALTSTNAQNKHYGDWNVGVSPSGSIYAFTTQGAQIKGGNIGVDLTFFISNDENGTISFQIDRNPIYEYEEGRTGLTVYSIVDDSSKQLLHGKISTEGYPMFRKNKKSDYTLWDLIKDMKAGNNVYFQTTGASGPKVFKFPLNGFTSAVNEAIRLFKVNKTSNPFDSNNEDEDPF